MKKFIVYVFLLTSLMSSQLAMSQDNITWPLKSGVYGNFIVADIIGYYWFTSELMHAKRMNDKPLRKVIEDLDEDDSASAVEQKMNLARFYKIHLMPREQDMVTIISMLMDAVEKDLELQKLIQQFKVIKEIDAVKQAKENMPYIVIYPAAGKDNAQKLLDKLYKLFKDKKGLNKTPRFNAKVTDLIYVAQGDGDDKAADRYDKYYELPAKVYYSKKEIPAEDGKEHYLRNPKNGKPIKN